MINSIKQFYQRAKEPLGFGNDLIDALLKIYVLVTTVLLFVNKPDTLVWKEKLAQVSPFISGILIFVVTILVVYAFKRNYENALFIVEQSRLDKRIGAAVQSILTINDYKKLIPKQILIEKIFGYFSQQAKIWARDSYLYQSNLTIRTYKGKITLSLSYIFFSKSKKSHITYVAENLRVPRSKKIRPGQLTSTDFVIKMKPFHKQKKWREFILESLDRIEADVAGRELYIDICMMVGDFVRFYADAGFVPHRSFEFYLYKGQMYKDFSAENFIKRM